MYSVFIIYSNLKNLTNIFKYNYSILFTYKKFKALYFWGKSTAHADCSIFPIFTQSHIPVFLADKITTRSIVFRKNSSHNARWSVYREWRSNREVTREYERKNSTRVELRGERADGRIDPSTLGARSPTAGLNVIQCGPTNNTITMTNIRDRVLINA